MGLLMSRVALGVVSIQVFCLIEKPNSLLALCSLPKGPWSWLVVIATFGLDRFLVRFWKSREPSS